MSDGTNEAALRAAIERLIAAERAKDTRRIGELLSADYLGIDPGGNTLDRATVLARFADPGFSFAEHAVDELRIRFFGAAAVVQGRARLAGSFGGRAFAGEFRFTDVWVDRGAGWQVAASHLTAIAPG